MNAEDILALDEDDKKLLEELEKLGEDKLVELLRDLRAERALELQIYATREQWLWVPWTTCLAASVVSMTSGSPVIRIGVTVVTGLLAWWVAHRRRPGLAGSFNAINIRHKWVVHITRCLRAKARLRVLGFDDRLSVGKGQPPRDPIHVGSFRFPLHARSWTVALWAGLITVAVLSSLVTWSPETLAIPKLLQHAPKGP